jgi:hypothetical protein
MKNVKKNIMIFGAVVIALLMVSSATAVITPQSNEISKSGTVVAGSINYVEPGIYLSGSEQRAILSDALDFVDDSDFRILLQEIIEEMDYGPVESDDIEQIISDNGLEVGNIGFGGISTSGPGPYPDTSGGWAFCPHRPFCLGVFFSIILPFHAVYQQSIDNNPNYPVQITIGGKFIDYEIVGVAIGFFGFAWNNVAPYMGFRVQGFALLTCYLNLATGNQQSSPQITPNIQIQNSLQSNPYVNQQAIQILRGTQQSSPTNR